MHYPSDLLYSKSHERVALEGTTAHIGVTDYAQDAMGDIVFVNLPSEADEVVLGESFAELESVKAVAQAYSPVSGTISAVNESLLDAPEAINETPYEAWLIEVTGISEKEELLSAEEYQAFLLSLKEE